MHWLRVGFVLVLALSGCRMIDAAAELRVGRRRAEEIRNEEVSRADTPCGTEGARLD